MGPPRPITVRCLLSLGAPEVIVQGWVLMEAHGADTLIVELDLGDTEFVWARVHPDFSGQFEVAYRECCLDHLLDAL